MKRLLIAQALLTGSLGILFAAEDIDLAATLREGLRKYAARDFEGAVKSWREGLEAARVQQDALFEGSFHGNLGIAYIELKRLADAETHLTEAIRLARENNDVQGEKNRLNTLGGLQLMRGEFREALRNLDRALELSIALGDRLLESDVRSNLGLAHIGLKEYGKAEKQLEAAIEAGDEARKKRDRERLAVLKKLLASTPR